MVDSQFLLFQSNPEVIAGKFTYLLLFVCFFTCLRSYLTNNSLAINHLPWSPLTIYHNRHSQNKMIWPLLCWNFESWSSFPDKGQTLALSTGCVFRKVSKDKKDKIAVSVLLVCLSCRHCSSAFVLTCSRQKPSSFVPSQEWRLWPRQLVLRDKNRLKTGIAIISNRFRKQEKNIKVNAYHCSSPGNCYYF